MIGVPVADEAPQVRNIVSQQTQALVLPPVRLLVADQALAVQVLGQDVDAERHQADARVAEGSQEPGDDVAGGAGDHKLPSLVHVPGVPATVQNQPFGWPTAGFVLAQ